ncbi:MAP3K13 [Branchiostoma lanceolatum]|uniref:MAP3K13 protein n=1 Tax=Branchiostoma lanceolatum TaxID=7740 RepID=A0A8J9ZVU0_BRALA|nr:MAP3K13 [Branchiostoma lanceolatum]
MADGTTTVQDGGEKEIELTEEVIAKCNITRARKISTKHHIPIDDLENIGEMRQRFRQHMRQGGKQTHKEILHTVSDLKDKDDGARKRLQGILKDVQKILETCDDQICRQLELEQHTADHKTKIAHHLETLQSIDCPILVAGETSSGKSSLINVLLGEDFLPSRHLSWSSVICKVQYGENKKAIVHFKDKRKPVTIPLPAGMDDLAEHLFTKSDREKGSECKEVDIYLPLDYLKSGIFIVDSPGIGESDVMTAAVMEYLQQAFAFIYVIKSDNAGGVQEDRLKKLLKEVRKSRNQDKLQSINPASAIFVCNRWDIVERHGAEEAQNVKQDIIRKLRACWSGFQDHQVFFMNTEHAARDLEAGYVADDLARLAEGIEELIPRALQAKTHPSWNWIRHLVGRVLHYINSFLTKSAVTSTQLRQRYDRAKDEIRRLQENADTMMTDQKEKLEEVKGELVASMGTFLREETTESAMQSWAESEVPEVVKGMEWDVLQYQIESSTSARLEELIDEWEMKMKHFQSKTDEMMAIIIKGMSTVKVRLSKIEDELHNPDEHRYMAVFQPQKPQRKKGVRDFVDLSTEHLDLSDKMLLGITAPLMATFGVIGAVAASPVLAVMGIQALKKKYTDQQERRKYKADKCKYMAERAMEKLEDFRANDESICKYVEERLKPVQDYLQAFEDNLPKKVKAQLELMEKISQDQRTARELASDYQPLLEKVSGMKTELALFELEELNLLDPCRVKCAEVDDAVKFQRGNISLRKGKVTTTRRSKMDATIKSYRTKIDETTVGDFTTVRKLMHDNILRFIGICFIDEMPQLVLQAADGCLRECLQKGPKVSGMFGLNTLPAMRGVCAGLQYLHSKQLVSFGLSQDTVLVVDRDGGDSRFKLAHVCEPRALHLSPEDYSGPAGPYVYLPPEVLREGVAYDSRSDMYALGLMMWELWFEQKAFEKSEESMTLQSFIGTNMQLETSKPHKHVTVEEDAGEKWSTIIQECLRPPVDRNLTSSEAMQQLQGVSKDQ